jgi:pre-mRNA-splicing factor CWC26
MQRQGKVHKKSLSFATHALLPVILVQLQLHINIMGLADYLAQNYLSADKPSKGKKRKRKNADDAGLIIADEDVSGLSKSQNRNDDGHDIPMMIPGGANISKRTTTWKTFGKAAPSNDEQAAADAILADAAAETEARNAEDEDAPAVVGEDEEMENAGPQMASGAMAGLQTAEQVAKAVKRREREEKKAMQDMGMDPTGKSQETIYRDASGRIINVAMKRAELRRQADDEARKKADEADSRRGDVQKREKEARTRELEKAKTMSLSRYADDQQLNDEQKEQERWNDPAARFLSKGTTKGTATTTTGRKKTYTGAFEPNRYGIRPGYRWDGVDRSIGFEKRWFEARNQQQNIKDLKYAWQMDE